MNWSGITTTGLLVLLLGLIPATGLAQQTGEGDDSTSRIQELFDEGAKAYFQGNYADALVAFRKAYQHKKKAIILYNIALCQGKLGKYDKALSNSEKAARMGKMPDEPAVANQGFQAALRTRRHARRVAGESADRSEQDEISVTESTDSGPPWRWIGAGAAAGGLASLAASGIVTVGLQKDFQTLESEANGGARAEYDRLQTSIPKKQTVGRVLLYSGIGLTAVGTTLFLLDSPSSEGGPSHAIGPAAVGDGWGILVRGTLR
mgnify:CR=1 FL=1